jgi:hypothetical protein
MDLVTKQPIVPAPVANGIYPWLFVKEWRMMHLTMAGNNLHVTVGSPGTGKTYQQLYKAERLAYNKRGEPTLFQPKYLWEHVAWGAGDLATIVDALSNQTSTRNTRGYQLIVDEGQLALFSKDAMKEEVKNLSKILMTIRSKRWGIQINLPAFGMLSKDVRTIVNTAVVMRGVPTNYSFGSYYNIEQNPFDGEIYWRKPLFYKIHKTVSGIPMIERKSGGVLTWPKPSKECCRVYERLKKEHQNELYSKFKDGIITAEGGDQVQVLKERKIFEMASMVIEAGKRVMAGKRLVPSRVRALLGLSLKAKDKKMLYDVMDKAELMIQSNFNPDSTIENEQGVRIVGNSPQPQGTNNIRSTKKSNSGMPDRGVSHYAYSRTGLT